MMTLGEYMADYRGEGEMYGGEWTSKTEGDIPKTIVVGEHKGYTISYESKPEGSFPMGGFTAFKDFRKSPHKSADLCSIIAEINQFEDRQSEVGPATPMPYVTAGKAIKAMYQNFAPNPLHEAWATEIKAYCGIYRCCPDTFDAVKHILQAQRDELKEMMGKEYPVNMAGAPQSEEFRAVLEHVRDMCHAGDTVENIKTIIDASLSVAEGQAVLVNERQRAEIRRALILGHASDEVKELF